MGLGDGGDKEGLVSWEDLGSFFGFWFRLVVSSVRVQVGFFWGEDEEGNGLYGKWRHLPMETMGQIVARSSDQYHKAYLTRK